MAKREAISSRGNPPVRDCGHEGASELRAEGRCTEIENGAIFSQGGVLSSSPDGELLQETTGPLRPIPATTAARAGRDPCRTGIPPPRPGYAPRGLPSASEESRRDAFRPPFGQGASGARRLRHRWCSRNRQRGESPQDEPVAAREDVSSRGALADPEPPGGISACRKGGSPDAGEGPAWKRPGPWRAVWDQWKVSTNTSADFVGEKRPGWHRPNRAGALLLQPLQV